MKYRKMTENSDSAPDTEHEQIEAARHRLEAVAPSLRKRPRQDVVAVLGELLDRIRDVESSWHATLVRDAAASSGFSLETVAAAKLLAPAIASLGDSASSRLDEVQSLPDRDVALHSIDERGERLEAFGPVG